MHELEIIPAGVAEKPVLENLMHLYLYEFTDYTHDDPDEQGCFIDEHLPRYWAEPGRYPFLVKFRGKPAGFVLVRNTEDEKGGKITHHIAEFFVMRKHRRKKIGQQMAWHMFDTFPGRWNVEEMAENLPAQVFWRRVIGEYTGGQYQEVTKPEWDGPVQEFDTSKRKEAKE